MNDPYRTRPGQGERVPSVRGAAPRLSPLGSGLRTRSRDAYERSSTPASAPLSPVRSESRSPPPPCSIAEPPFYDGPRAIVGRPVQVWVRGADGDDAARALLFRQAEVRARAQISLMAPTVEAVGRVRLIVESPAGPALVHNFRNHLTCGTYLPPDVAAASEAIQAIVEVIAQQPPPPAATWKSWSDWRLCVHVALLSAALGLQESCGAPPDGAFHGAVADGQ